MSAPAGIALATPNSMTISTGTNFDQVAQRDTNQTTGRRWVHNVGESVSLFVSGIVTGSKSAIKETLKLIAAKGKVQIQAQSDEMEVTADKDLKLSSVTRDITAAAKDGIVVTSGGAYARIKGGNIDIHCPGTLEIRAARIVLSGPDGMQVAMPEMPVPGEHLYSQRLVAVNPIDGSAQTTGYKLHQEQTELEKGKTGADGASPRRIRDEREQLVAMAGAKGKWHVEFPVYDTPFPVDWGDGLHE
jgi:type VI secretion system secreted protein VgrG